MEADDMVGRLEGEMKKFAHKFGDVAAAHFTSLEPFGNEIVRLLQVMEDDVRTEAFVARLVDFSRAVLEIQKESKSMPVLKELPLPSYDLWLPFKAKSKNPEAKYLDEANRVFKESLAEMVTTWRRLEQVRRREDLATSTKRADPALEALRDAILNLYEYCNKCCAAITANKTPLFAPSQTAHSNLFVRLMPYAVECEADFDRFILGLYLVFDERLRTDVRQRDHQLPDPLAKISQILHTGHFRDLGLLRNTTTEAHDHKEESWNVVSIYQRLIGVRKPIAADDSTNWRRLQEAVLQMLLAVLRDVSDAFETAEISET